MKVFFHKDKFVATMMLNAIPTVGHKVYIRIPSPDDEPSYDGNERELVVDEVIWDLPLNVVHIHLTEEPCQE